MTFPPRALAAVVACTIVLPLAGVPNHYGPDEVRCVYKLRQHCSPSGCQRLDVGSAYLLSPSLTTLRMPEPSGQTEALPELRRCDTKGCTPFRVSSATSGAFLNVWKHDGGYLLKVYTGPDDPITELRHGDFVEVATSLLDTYTGYGRCPFDG